MGKLTDSIEQNYKFSQDKLTHSSLGSPHALILPSTLKMFLQASEDYYERFWLGVTLRTVRFFALLIALLLP